MPAAGSRLSASAAAAALLAVVAAGLAGCGGGVAAPLDQAQAVIAKQTLAALDQRGLPVDGDHIGCNGPFAAPTVVCVGASTDEPTSDVTGSFTPLTDASRPCPGTLTVRYGATTVTTERLDPCR